MVFYLKGDMQVHEYNADKRVWTIPLVGGFISLAGLFFLTMAAGKGAYCKQSAVYGKNAAGYLIQHKAVKANAPQRAASKRIRDDGKQNGR